MSTDAQQVDLTGPSQGRYLTVLTDAGIVYVSTGLVDTRTGRPVVMVEVETATGGKWETDVVRGGRLGGTRTAIRIARQEN